ncbi:unnamed protein product [Rotaria sp. Silwood1]|nr:unnamed protein product [Rotaria sp. Silwood1]
MKRKTPFTSPIKNKSNPDSPGHIEENSSDDLSLKETAENCPDNQPNEKRVAGKGPIWSKISREQFISAVNELGPDKEQLDVETWRLNDFTRSKESVWSRLILKLSLNHTENIRHSLYSFWGRNLKKKTNDPSKKNQIDSVREDAKSDNENKVESATLHSEIKPLTSNASLPYPGTRSAVEHQLNLPSIIESSFILTSKQWKELYDSSTREMKPGWTQMFFEKVCSCNFHCSLAFKKHHIILEDTRKINSSFFRCIAICKITSCEQIFEIFIRDEPIGRDSIVARIRAIGDENHSADDKGTARNLTGQDRMDVGRLANEIGPLKVFQQKVENANEEMLSARNFTGCETMEVIKQAAAEDYLKHFRLDEDIFRECRVRQQLIEDLDVYSAKIKGYVQVMGEKPFRLHLTTEAQVLRFITYCAKSAYSHVHTDATGSIVKNLPHQKDVLLYAAIFKDGICYSDVALIHLAIYFFTYFILFYFYFVFRFSFLSR